MTVHHFSPSVYYNTCGSHPPVLRITEGDTVVTTTVDAAGVDANGDQVALGINPLTGPFYIDNADEGDSLAVHLDDIRLSRSSGYTLNSVAPNIVDPKFTYRLPKRKRVSWHIDRERGETFLVQAGSVLKQLILPVTPMIGSLGVAPPNGQAISTETAAEHGGNLDYLGLQAGTTIYLPIFVPGALLFVGDGHATQGEGEIVGTGVETTLEIQFTVQVRKHRRINRPRGENQNYFFTFGSARPFDQAIQLATTEMILWLQNDWGLAIDEVSLVLGQCVEYDIANVYNPAYTVVCKIRKQWLDIFEVPPI